MSVPGDEPEIQFAAPSAQVMAWRNPRVRLPVLLAILVGLCVYFGITRLGGGGTSQATGLACPWQDYPPTIQVPARAVRRAVLAAGLRSLIGTGRYDVQGFQDPATAWQDNPPNPHDTPASAGGFELRWWSAGGDHDVAVMFLFRTPAQARRYVALAAAPRCHAGAIELGTVEPEGGHELVWVNPLHALQADVFFARGREAFRITDVPPQAPGLTPGNANPDWVVRAAPRLACRVAIAGCRIRNLPSPPPRADCRCASPLPKARVLGDADARSVAASVVARTVNVMGLASRQREAAAASGAAPAQ